MHPRTGRPLLHAVLLHTHDARHHLAPPQGSGRGRPAAGGWWRLVNNAHRTRHAVKYHPTRVLTLTYQPFVLTISAAVFTYHEAKVNTRLRNLVGYTMFFLSSLCAGHSSGRGGIAAFIGVCAILAVFGIAEGHVEGAMIGDLSSMCPEFIQSFSAGMAASGAITSALRLLPIVKFYRSKAASEGSLTVMADLAASGIGRHPNSSPLVEEGPAPPERLSNKQLLAQNVDYALHVFLIYLLTLSIFPGSSLKMSDRTAWVPDLIGQCLPLVGRIKLTSRKGIWVAVLARFAGPAFYYAGKRGGEGWMVALASALGLSNGYLTLCVLTEAPRGGRSRTLCNLLVFCLLAGIFAGAVLDWLWLVGRGW
uniref:Uncharacterized protein n=1 Tax=Setaria viridis TaxID=4556 RepID=A0A4U6W076_SETVI|nr:hypothetical protein SEVIR_2G361600v2 [Setaria viridis]